MVTIDDSYTSAKGCTATLGNFAKVTFDAISETHRGLEFMTHHGKEHGISVPNFLDILCYDTLDGPLLIVKRELDTQAETITSEFMIT
ncbi:hypothetical protein STEG23_008704, partial [Scotinomys teguina]